MKIQCLIIRPGGTKVDFDAPKRQYHFKPSSDDPRHIAEVGEASHAAMLLRIREAYQPVDGDVVQSASDEGSDLPNRVLAGSSVHDARYTIHGGDEIELEDLVSMAFDDSGLSEAEWNDLPDQERYEYIDATLTELRGGERDEEENTPSKPTEITTPEPEPLTELAPEPDPEHTPAPPQPDAEQLPPGKTGDEQPTSDELANLSHDELREKFKDRFGRYPSNKMKTENIVAALAEDDD